MNEVPKKRKLKMSRVILLICMLVVLIALVFGVGWYLVEHHKPADTKAPIITFNSANEVTLTFVDGEMNTEDLFTIEDDSEVTINEITPALDTVEDGEHNICVTASDSHMNSVKTCATMHIKIEEEILEKDIKFETVEDIVHAFIDKRNLSEDSFGFFYYSPEDDQRYVYNGDGVFNAASTIKVPLNMLYYDRINSGSIHPKASYVFYESDIEGESSPTNQVYAPNQAVPLTYLLKESIVDSDNTATNILIRNLGGFTRFRNLLDPLSPAPLPKETYTENITSPNYMLDILKTLYQNSDKYTELIENMKNAASGEYLKRSSQKFEIAQKYGDYDGNIHVMGIVYTPKPYMVGIFTKDVLRAEKFIKELNEQLINYQLMK